MTLFQLISLLLELLVQALRAFQTRKQEERREKLEVDPADAFADHFGMPDNEANEAGDKIK